MTRGERETEVAYTCLHIMTKLCCVAIVHVPNGTLFLIQYTPLHQVLISQSLCDIKIIVRTFVQCKFSIEGVSQSLR